MTLGKTKPVTPATRGQPRGVRCAKITPASLEPIEDYQSTSFKIGDAPAKFLPSFIVTLAELDRGHTVSPPPCPVDDREDSVGPDFGIVGRSGLRISGWPLRSIADDDVD